MFQEAQKSYVGDPGKWSHLSRQGYAPEGLVGLLAHIIFYSFLVIVSIQKQVHLFPNRSSSYQSWCIFQIGNGGKENPSLRDFQEWNNDLGTDMWIHMVWSHQTPPPTPTHLPTLHLIHQTLPSLCFQSQNVAPYSPLLNLCRAVARPPFLPSDMAQHHHSFFWS